LNIGANQKMNNFSIVYGINGTVSVAYLFGITDDFEASSVDGNDSG